MQIYGIPRRWLLPLISDASVRSVLERIMNLKQGEFEDLYNPEFQSFLVSYLHIDLSLLNRIAQMLRTEHLLGSVPRAALHGSSWVAMMVRR